jgi:hypothetical protein
MATDGWLEYNGVEIVNLSRTVQLAEALGIDSVWVNPSTVQWIQDTLGGVDYDSPTTAPWYDAGYPASAEFAGVIPLGFPGLDDSTTEASTVEYVTDGGRSGRQRNATLVIVGSIALVASTDRGADYGKRWLDKVLRNSGARTFCSGADLRYFRFPREGAPVVHRRDVRLTRGTSITRKRSTDCAVTWLATFTLTCDDPFEYSEQVDVLAGLGGPTPTGNVIDSAFIELIESSCPVYDYTPIYDPLYPALVPSPTSPDFYPAGWAIEDGLTFQRYWARITPPEPSSLNVVPVISLTTDVDARMVRVSIWPSDSDPSDQCDPLFSVVISYLPAGVGTFYIDGEQKAAYVWDGFSAAVRRTDSLVYAPNAEPVQWSALNDPTNLLVTLDLFYLGVSVEGGGDVRAALGFVSKSD